MIVRIGGASWVQSTGGPTIFVSRTLVRAWTGAVADSEKLSGQTRLDPGHVHDQDDYTRACQVRDYVDILRVNGGDALVLNDLPLLTTWRSSPTGAAGMIVRWEFVDDESAVDRYLSRIEMTETITAPTFVDVTDTRQMIFDAAVPGARVGADEAIETDLNIGRYRITTGYFRPDMTISLLIHKFDSSGLMKSKDNSQPTTPVIQTTFATK